MTYLEFLLLFVALPTLVLALIRPGLPSSYPGKRPYVLLPIMAVIALIYTTPWDNYLVESGVWWYAEDAVLGTIGFVPVEEYLFFVIQPLLCGLVFYHVLSRSGDISPPDSARRPIFVTGFLVLCFAAGFGALQTTSGRYLGLILVWALPVLLLQWLIGWKLLRRMYRPIWLAIGLSSVYLWFADGFAISKGIWTISEEYTLGLGVLGLPIEEAVFFLVTNIMVVQGLALFLEQTFRKT